MTAPRIVGGANSRAERDEERKEYYNVSHPPNSLGAGE
jgi:hypothetical protein